MENSFVKAKKNKIKQSTEAVVLTSIIRVFLILWAILVLYPLIWAVMASFKTSAEFMSNAWSLPKKLNFNNYKIAWLDSNFSSYFFNSVFVTLGALVLTLIMVATNSYIFAKFRHPVVRAIERFYAIFMMVPQVLLLIPLMYLCMKYNMQNLYTLIVLYAIQGVPFYCFLMTPFVKGLNDSLLEAAEIDGAGELYKFIKIIIPMCWPAVFMVALLSIIGSWNEYVMAITLINNSRMYTLPVGINDVITDSNNSYGMQFATLIIAMLPILIVYAIFQKPLQNGMSAADGVKG